MPSNTRVPRSRPGDGKEIELFWHISRSLATAMQPEEILNLIVRMTADVMGSNVCSLMVLDESTQELKIVATVALSDAYRNKPPLKVGESISGEAVLRKEPVSVLDVTQDSRYRFPDIARNDGIVSMLSVPMIMGERVVGVINCYTPSRRKFSEREVKILQAVASQSAIAIEQSKLREESRAARAALEEKAVIEKAKKLLMEQETISEEKAASLLDTIANDQQMPLVDVANAVISIDELRRSRSGGA